MATIELQQVRCPNCGANISQFNRFKQTVECPYCHTVLQNPAAMAVQRNMPQPESIIPFQTQDYDFGKQLLNALIKRNYVPRDIFDYLKTGDVMKAFLPMYLFEGMYQANWSGKVTDRYQENGESKSRERFVNGVAGGNFSFFCLAYEGNDIPPELQDFARVISFPQNVQRSYDFSVLSNEGGDFMTMEANAEKNSLWQRYGNQEVHNQAESEVKRIAGNNVHDLNWSVAPQLMGQGQLVLVPFWFIYYFYRDTQYHFMMDGLGSKNKLTAPMDQGEKDEVNKYNWSMWVSLAILLIGIILLVAKVSLGAIVAPVGGIASLATIIFYFVRRGQILKASRAFRDEGAQRFMQQQ